MKINDKIENAKRQLANRLGAASEQYSPKTKKWTLVIAGLCCASVCLLVMTLPFMEPQKGKLNQNAVIPPVIGLPQPGPLLTHKDQEVLQGFIQTMDSLKRVDRNTYHNAIKGREGMIDSILFLLRYSGQQLINK